MRIPVVDGDTLGHALESGQLFADFGSAAVKGKGKRIEEVPNSSDKQIKPNPVSCLSGLPNKYGMATVYTTGRRILVSDNAGYAYEVIARDGQVIWLTELLDLSGREWHG